jgi:chromosome segregation ATPase
MARPKSSIVGFVDLGISATNAVGLKSMKRRLGDISTELSNETNQINKELASLRNAQLATVAGMIEIHNRLETIELERYKPDLSRFDKEIKKLQSEINQNSQKISQHKSTIEELDSRSPVILQEIEQKNRELLELWKSVEHILPK